MARLFWKVGEAMPANLYNPVVQTLLPRPLAWLTVDDETVSLLEGFSAASYTPTTFYFASQALPKKTLHLLLETRKCSISTCTARDPLPLVAASLSDQHGNVPRLSQKDLNLAFGKGLEAGYPSIVQSSPLHFFCKLKNFVPLDKDERQGLVVLTAETVVIHPEAQSQPTPEMFETRPNIVSKVDAACIQPLVSLGGGRFAELDYPLKSLPRPVYNEAGQRWISREPVDAAPSIVPETPFPTCLWKYREHGGTSPLGFNATTALVMPRPIGWISTYSTDKCLHVAPYSFFMDVSRDILAPMVAFAGYRKNGAPKDAQKDAQEMGFFCFNLVSRDLITEMNLSAAEIPHNDSEFALAELQHEVGRWVDAPRVKRSLVTYECEYVQTVDVATFSLVIGRVVGVSMDESIVDAATGQIIRDKLQPLSRLGYMDEYGIVGTPIAVQKESLI